MRLNQQVGYSRLRRGVTLVEVLISMFVMAIGLMGILALFLIGAASTAQAVKDERTKQLADVAEANFRIYWRSVWFDQIGQKIQSPPAPKNSNFFSYNMNGFFNGGSAGSIDSEGLLQTDTQMLTNEPSFVALDDTNPTFSVPSMFTDTQAPIFLNSPTRVISSLPSNPVYIDPIGYAVQPFTTRTPPTVASGFRGAVAGAEFQAPATAAFPSLFLPVLARRTMSVINDPAVNFTNGSAFLSALAFTPPAPPALPYQQPIGQLRFLSMLEDFTSFNNGSTGNINLGINAERGGRYNAAFLIQRPNNSVRQEVNLKIVVYQGRTLDQPAAETNFGTVLIPPNTDLVSVISNGLPNIRKGSWVLLANPAQANPPKGLNPAEAFADFYRVVSFTSTAGAGSPTFNMSVSPPIRDHAQGGAYQATVMVLDNVVEVFDRGLITPFQVPTR